VLEPEHGIVAIGSGGAYAQAAARALLQHTEMAPPQIVKQALDRSPATCASTPTRTTRDRGSLNPTRVPPAARRAARAALPDAAMSMTPQEIVSELDRHIVGQSEAKRAVAIALRNRWRRQQVDEKLRGEITPKNILMIGPTGVGKTEIARRLARLADAPFIKVEATKFTEVGYVGKDVDTIVRDLVEIAVKQEREAAMRRHRTPRRRRRRRARPRRPGAATAHRRCTRRIGHAGARQHGAPGDAQAPARRHAGRQGD
jgi:hypothetical protein